MIDSTATIAAPHTRIHEQLRSAQRWHAGLVLAVPALGTVLALTELYMGRLHGWHVALLSVAYAWTMFGITVGFHRLFTHRAFKTTAVVRALLAVGGSMAGQGPPLYWVTNHRLHHQRSDQRGDPHSPYVNGKRALSGWRGLLHAHVGWAFDHELVNPLELSRDLLQDSTVRWVNKHYLGWLALSLIAPAALGGLLTASWRGAYEGLLWGGLVRLFLNLHVTCAINSFTHSFGYQTYRTKDQSRNNVWLAIPTLGEAWHNNHHAFPNSAMLGLAWWEIDLGAWLVRALAWFGLASEVQVAPQRARQRKQLRRSVGHDSDS